MEDEHGTGHDAPRSASSASTSVTHAKYQSNSNSLTATVPETVMAEQVTNDVVKEAQSVGRPAPIDDTASATNSSAANSEQPSGPATANTKTSEPPSASSTNATTTDSASAAGAQALVNSNGQTAAVSNNVKQSTSAPKETSEALQNGDSGEQSGAESLQVNGEAVSGSDTDISRPGSVDPSKQDTGHVRSSSTKKPAAFKSVSVTKSFLAKSAASTPATSPGLKAAPAVQPPTSSVLTAKPRLVAKSGTANTPRALGKMNGAGSGPDASKVWNKNQPVPPPPPKQYTDEELKQQYGIHLATRLPMDEAGKEAKWADIDEDDGDWAPDTVEWMDGTKSSVTAPENQPPPVEEPPKPIVLAKPEPAADTPKPAAPTATSAPKTSVTGGPKTVLKPGGHAQSGATKSSLVLKGQPEKPSLVAKPSTGAPAKSPWATLPPVEKVPPVQINPLVQQQPTNHRFPTQDHRAYEPMPPHHGREIAPDDFNRAWREERGGRELFNSQNGRYEPVNDARRGSFRDSGYRQQQHPSLLQRPSHDGPAEPSSAFQTSRSSADMPSWGRRRTSSNVSGGPGRRMSFDRRGPEFPNAIVDEEQQAQPLVNGAEATGSEAPRQSSLVHAASPHVAQAHPAAPQGLAPPPVNAASPAAIAAPTMEDAVEAQKRMMADKIERARLKKQQQLEAEKKEEEEKKARIAKRLAALGEAPKPKSSEKPPSPAAGHSPQKVDAALAPVQSPPKPPVPSHDGEVAQYGMMKVHQPHPVKKPSPVPQSAKPTEPQTNAHADNQVRLPMSLDQPLVLPFDSNRDHAKKATEHSRPLADSQIPQGPKPTQPAWQSGSGSQTRGGWTSQVWGSAQTRDRNLGNGTFDSGFNRGQPRPGAQQQLPAQPSSASIAPIGVDPAAPATSHTVKMPLSSQPMHSQSRQLPAQAGPGPIAPPADNKWGNFAAHIARDDANMVVKAHQDRERMGGETFRPELRETYKDPRGKAQTMVHSKVAGSTGLDSSVSARVSPAGSELKLRDEAMKPSHDGSSPQQPLIQGTPLQQTAGSRSSRFFPRPIETACQAPMTTSNKADSPPPPPETESHPVFAGSVVGHPLVRLPRPSPVVRLPKPAQDFVDPSVNMPPRGYHGPGARPLAMNPEWQARFNKLLDKPAASDAAPNARPFAAVPVAVPVKPSALAVAASSKASLDVRGYAGSATVSLPSAAVRKISGTDRNRGTFTRDGTAALFEDREFGSLPTVRLPKVPHLSANEPAISLPKDDIYIRLVRKENPFTTKRLDAFDFGAGTEIDVVVRLAHMRIPITKTMPKPRRGKGNGPYSKPKRNGTPTGPQTGGAKDRPRKPSQQGQGERANSSPRVNLPSAWPAQPRPAATPKRESWAQRAAAAPVH